ncbi:MAG: hypothetical protein Q8L55_14075 [Phycisphaerales bacterium]|nr:hypothetical protein [Phycisphaerales bacterium]
MRCLVLLGLLSACVGLLQGCSALLATQGTFYGNWPGMPVERTQRTSFEQKWGAPVGTVTDDEGHEYLEYHTRIWAPKGMQSGQGEAMAGMVTLGLSEIYFLPVHAARLCGLFDYRLESRVQWNADGSVFAVMEKQQETTHGLPRDWTRRVIDASTHADASAPPAERSTSGQLSDDARTPTTGTGP